MNLNSYLSSSEEWKFTQNKFCFSAWVITIRFKPVSFKVKVSSRHAPPGSLISFEMKCAAYGFFVLCWSDLHRLQRLTWLVERTKERTTEYLFDRRTLITIINSLVFSKLLYCSSVWANTANKNIELLQTVQNFAARIVSGTRKFDHVTPILKQLQWLPIVKQLEVRDATMVFKCLNGLAPPYRCQKFKTRSEVHNCNTRNRDRLHIPLCRTAAGQRAFTFTGQRLWNSLQDEFQSITNLDVLS